MTCKNCAFLRVTPDKLGRHIARGNACYPCDAPVPDLPALPDSMIKHVEFRWPPSRSWMNGADGVGCAAFVARQKKK